MIGLISNRIDQIDQLELFMESFIESGIPPVDISYIPDKYKNAILERSVSDLVEKKQPSGLLKPYIENAEIGSDIISGIEHDYLVGSITESQYQELVKQFSLFIEACVHTEFAIGAMLPQPGTWGCQYKYKEEDSDEGEDNGEDLDDLIDIDESMMEYIQNPDYDYSVYVEKSAIDAVKGISSKIGGKFKISSKQLRNIVDKAALKSKIRVAKLKKADPGKIAELEKQLVTKEEESRALKKGITPESLKQLDQAANKVEAAFKKKEQEGIEQVEQLSTDEIKEMLAENVVVKPYATEDEILNEAYFGKTPELEQAEDILGQLIEEIKRDPYNSFIHHPLNKKFEKILQKQFGFKKVFILWDRSSVVNTSAFTYISSSIINGSDDVLFIKNKKSGYYDKKHKHIAYIRISTNLVKDMDLTPAENLAIILHEFGHNFDKTTYAKINLSIMYLNILCSIFVSPLNAVSVVPTTDFGKNFLGELRRMGDKVRGYLVNLMPPLKKVEMIFQKLGNIMVLGGEIISAPIGMLMAPLYILLSPWIHLLNVPTNKSEEFADSFATAYGYGPELGRALSKMDKLNVLNFSKLKDERNMNPVQKFCYDMVLMEREILGFALGASHGSTASRITQCKRALMDDLDKGNYPPELKQELLNSISKLEETYQKCLEVEEKGNKFVLTSFVRNFLMKLFKGNTSFIAKLFPRGAVDAVYEYESAYNEDYYYNLITGRDETYIKLEKAQQDNDLNLIHDYENNLKYYQIQIEKANEYIEEAANIDKEIKPIIKKLNEKGYKTKYSSAGHTQLRKKEDKYRDGVYKGKLYSDARIMFDKDYNFPKAPKHWIWKVVDGKDYLDIDPKGYYLTKGDTPAEAFNKWKTMYMDTLRTWVENLPDQKDTQGEVEAKDTKGRHITLEEVDNMKEFEDFFEATMNEIDNDIMEDGYDSVFIY